MSIVIHIKDIQQTKDLINMIGSDNSDVAKDMLNNILVFVIKHLKCDDVGIIGSLINDSRVDLASNGSKLLEYAIINGDTEVIKLLLTNPHINPHSPNYYAIIDAAQYCSPDIIKLLLDDPRVDPTIDDNHSIRKASFHDKFENVELLLKDPRVDPSSLDCRSFRNACIYGYVNIVKLLLTDSRINPSVLENEALIQASSKGHIKIIELLFADPRFNATNEHYKNALNHASFGKHTEVVKLLNQKIIDTAKQLKDDSMTKEEFVKDMKEKMQKYQITGIFNNENNETIVVSDSQVLTF